MWGATWTAAASVTSVESSNPSAATWWRSAGACAGPTCTLACSRTVMGRSSATAGTSSDSTGKRPRMIADHAITTAGVVVY